MNGWQFHEFNLPKLEDAIRRARGYGVNFLIFSHEFFRSVEGFLASDDDAQPDRPLGPRAAAASGARTSASSRAGRPTCGGIGDLATSQGIPYYLWVHEFDDLPTRFLVKGRVNMDDPACGPTCNDATSGCWPPCPAPPASCSPCTRATSRCSATATSPPGPRVADVPERVYRVSKLLYDLLARKGKQLIVRNFFYEPLEMAHFKRGVERLPDDVIVMSKDTTHEFHPFYPWDPLHGQMGRKRQIIEIDLGVEKAWDPRGAYAQTDYIRRVAGRARETRAAGLVGRARLHAAEPFVDSHEVNLYAFSRFLADPALRVDRVLADWAARRYPPRAVPHVVAALKRTEDINHRGRWHLEYWLHKEIGREWADYAYLYSRVLLRSRYKWTQAPADRDLEDKLYHPDAGDLRAGPWQRRTRWWPRCGPAKPTCARRPATCRPPSWPRWRRTSASCSTPPSSARVAAGLPRAAPVPRRTASRRTGGRWRRPSPRSSSASARPGSPTGSTRRPAAATTSTGSCGRCAGGWPIGAPPGRGRPHPGADPPGRRRGQLTRHAGRSLREISRHRRTGFAPGLALAVTRRPLRSAHRDWLTIRGEQGRIPLAAPGAGASGPGRGT